MPTYAPLETVSSKTPHGLRIPAIWNSAEALARADWMHEQIKAELAAIASAAEVVTR